MRNAPVIVVSGLPRSGTSLMMQLLDAAGVALVVDGVRGADADNPRGYFECEAVKRLATNAECLTTAPGRAIKIVSALVRHLPTTHDYRVLWMQRPLTEVLASQAAMLARRAQPAATDDDRLAEFFAQHLRTLEGWLAAQPNLRVLPVEYHALLRTPAEQLERIAVFLERPLDAARATAVVDPQLYRQRR